MEMASINKGYKMLKDDKEYIEGYFKICELFNRKRTLIDIYKEDSRKSKRKKSPETTKKEQREISDINTGIKKQDRLFWNKVDRSLKKGKHFAMEKLAAHYSLDLFEKKILLFFIYLEFHHISKNVCSENELVTTFDCEDSIIDKMKRLQYFTPAGALIKNRIIVKESRRAYIYSVMEYALSYEALDLFSKMLNGANIEKEAKMEKHTVSCEDVGYEKIPRYSLDDVKLKNDLKDKVTFFLSNFRENALDNLGAHQTIKNGKGLVFLFHGPPGTGKSMLAEAIAAYLNKKMLIVEFPKITSRWLGVTEKNISKIFRSARENDMLLCIDEADTLLYSRTYAVQEHDIRFVNVMLQELERFEGVAVLTTNMDMLLDQALERRVTLKIKFEEPSEELRSGIWKNHIPQTVSISGDVDFTALAKKYDFSGGYIKNAVLNALRRISLNKQSILTMEDLVFGANIEKEGAFNQKKKQAILGFAMQ